MTYQECTASIRNSSSQVQLPVSADPGKQQGMPQGIMVPATHWIEFLAPVQLRAHPWLIQVCGIEPAHGSLSFPPLCLPIFFVFNFLIFKELQKIQI